MHSFSGEAIGGDSVIELCSFGTGAILPPLPHSAGAHLPDVFLTTPSGPALLSSVPQGDQSAAQGWDLQSVSLWEALVQDSGRSWVVWLWRKVPFLPPNP